MSHPDEMLEVDKRCFIETGNAMYVWAAYSLARVCDAPVPDWVLRYLDMVARNLLSLSAEVKDGGGKDLGPKIASALKLEGKPRSGSPLAAYHSDWMVFGMNVRARLSEFGGKEYLAIESVAGTAGVSKSTVQRAFKLYEALFPGDAIFPDQALGD